VLKAWNMHLAATANAWRPDVVFVFKGLAVTRDALEACPGLRVHYHPDVRIDYAQDWGTTHETVGMQTRGGTVDVYDLHVTTKTFHVPQLKARGAKAVLYVPCAYDRDWHRPIGNGSAAEFSVGFIGSRLSDRRINLVRNVATTWGKRFYVCGHKWRRDPRVFCRATVAGPQYGLDLSVAVAKAPIQLGILNNGDQHTCRSYEIPAAGGVLIADRTEEHILMLDEGTEALFFSSEPELFEHIHRLATEPAVMRRMGTAAAKRIRGGANTYDDRWDSICQAIAAMC
jgi:spore maturation protein CgeB